MSSNLAATQTVSLDALTTIGDDVQVECLDGSTRRYVNLDPAASTPSLTRVFDAISELLPLYSSVHRGAGTKSQISTAAFEGARHAVRSFVDAEEDQEVIFLSHTTHAVNLLSALYEPGTRVLASPVEHHANMLPWHRHDVEFLPFAASADELLTVTEEALRRGGGAIRLLAVTGASNVTGEVWPVAQLAELAHAAGAEIFVDAAQLAPHRAISLRALGVDHLALSGHKLYAPFGAGALIARRQRLAAVEEPWLKGGGAVKFVTLGGTMWADLPDRHEAGSPNTLGVVALGVACDALAAAGMDAVAQHETELAQRMRSGLAEIPGLRLLELWPDGSCDRLGVATFELEGYADRLLAQILAAEHAIGVRNGCFCAHPLVTHLLEIDDATAETIRAEVLEGDQTHMPGAVRASLGLANREEDVDRLVAALADVAEHGPAAHYVYDRRANEYLPTHDQRSWPALSMRLSASPDPGGAPCGAN